MLSKLIRFSFIHAIASILYISPQVQANDVDNFIGFFNSIGNPNYNFTDSDTGTIFPSNNPPSVNKARDALAMLEFAEAAYTSHQSPNGWSRVETHAKDSGFNAVVFRSGAQIIIAYRGSELGTSDWVTDGGLTAGEFPAQYAQAMLLARSVKSRYPSDEIKLTGHSLGGGLATAAALQSGLNSIVFDATGINNNIYRSLVSEKGESQVKLNAKLIINFNLEGEFVSDTDHQQDADVVGNLESGTLQYGDIFYLSDDRFNPIVFNNSLARHLTPPLKEELSFLSNPFNRYNPFNLDGENNDINPFNLYVDLTLDDIDISFFLTFYAINSLPSLINDITP
ncbi:Mbeg1-like protein [Shewanella woodyi]|uniref:Mbeg1-like protein n=1 Tax=Shewanella woodyi TaxID=60961 RepID=UPI000A4F1ED7|nr:Mbeg1-like protein [Shewanella woodyi]